MNQISINYQGKPKKTKLNMSKIKEDIKEEKKNSKPVKFAEPLNLEKSFAVNVEAFFEGFNNIDNMDDYNLMMLVSSSYISLLDIVPKAVTQPVYAQYIMNLFSNVRYIEALSNVINSNKLDYAHKVYLNHIIYDYITFKNNDNILAIKALMRLSEIANISELTSLYGIGLPKELMQSVAISRNSTFDDYIAVRRVNLNLFRSNIDMSLQDVVDIYQTLFASCMSKLFDGTMFDVYNKEDMDNASDVQKEVYSKMGTAVLEMINTMPSEAIRTILYGFSINYYNNKHAYRFSMKLSNDYYRINKVIEQLASEGIYVP